MEILGKALVQTLFFLGGTATVGASDQFDVSDKSDASDLSDGPTPARPATGRKKSPRATDPRAEEAVKRTYQTWPFFSK